MPGPLRLRSRTTQVFCLLARRAASSIADTDRFRCVTLCESEGLSPDDGRVGDCACGFLPMRPYAFGALLVCSPIVLYVVLFLRGRADGYPAIPASVDEPAAYTKLVKYDRDEHTLVYGDETALRTGHAPLLDDGTYGKFVSSMPIVCVDVLLTRKSDGRILLVKRHSEPVVGKRIWNSPSQFRNLCKTEYHVVSPRVAAVSRRVTDRISCRMTAALSSSLISQRGLYWYPGGRLLMRESFFEAARRKVRKEVGLADMTACKLLGTWNTCTLPHVQSNSL